MRQQQFPPLTQDEAAAEIEALETVEAQDTGVVAPAVGDVDTYYIAPPDQAAWIPAWKLEVDWDGTERGRPIRLPKGQLDGPSGLLRARRPDGGRAFTIIKPKHLQEPGRFKCIVVDRCNFSGRRKIDLVEHAENCHPTESKPYAKIFAQIREQIVEDDPRARALISQLLEEPQEIAETPKAFFEEIVEEEAFEPPVKEIVPIETEPGEMNLSVQRPSDCPFPGCAWMAKSRSGLALPVGTHVMREHGGE